MKGSIQNTSIRKANGRLRSFFEKGRSAAPFISQERRKLWEELGVHVESRRKCVRAFRSQREEAPKANGN